MNALSRLSTIRTLALLLVLSLILAACGAETTPTEAPADSGAPATEAPAAESPTEAPVAESPTEAPAESPTEAPADNSGEGAAASDGIMTISQDQQATWVRNFNPFVNDNRWPTRYGIYEPMIIYNTIQGETMPWLATEWSWNDDNTELTFTLRDDVKWSDGEAFTAEDVAFTFNMYQEHEGLQGNASGVWQYLSGVEATDDTTVVFTFDTVFTPALYDIGHQVIVPEHLWSEVEDPLTFTNENPVGTGPFTEVTIFQNQIWQLEKNPNYWQPGKPYIQGLRFPSYPGNDQANLATINGENDWAGNFIPDIQKTYIEKDPENHNYWFPSTGDTVMLYVNTTKAPFDNVDVRKAISQCINRDQVVSIAMYDYTHPADATGLSDAYASWKESSEIADGEWVNYNVEEANALLDAAGLERGSNGVRTLEDGTPLSYDLNVVSGWTDWVSAVQIIAQNLEECGIQATVRTYDFSAWFERVQQGNFDMSIGWSAGGPTPFNFYRGQMSTEAFREVGEVATENWHRFVSEEADALLTEFASVSDPAQQQELANQLMAEYVAQAPSIPLFPGPQWYEYNTTRFTDFPSEENPYAVGSTYKEPERLLVLTTVKPR